MKILEICTTFYPGGIQRHVLQLASSLREFGHEVYLAGSPGPWLQDTGDPGYCNIDMSSIVGESSVPMAKKSLLGRILSALRAGLQLRAFVRDNNIDIIHAHESAPAIVAWLAALGRDIPIVLTYHGSHPARVRGFGRTGRITATRIISPSRLCVEQLHREAGVPEAMLQTIELGMEPAPEVDATEVAELRNRLLASPATDKLVLIIARLAYQKGIDILVEVVTQVSRQRDDVTFVLVGDGDLRQAVEEWIEQAGIGGRLLLEGHSGDPHRYLAAADLFLLTSRWEALPITIAEAFQMGVPVIATDTGGVTELVS